MTRKRKRSTSGKASSTGLPNPTVLAAQALGGQHRLAQALKTSPQVIHKWKVSGRIPAERVIAVSRATGVPVHVLRPDIYPLEYVV